MNKDDSTTEDNLREEYLKVRKLGSERKIFNKITTLFRLPSNDSIRKSQKIENKILERINNPAIICKVILDKDDDVEIKFEQKTKNEVEIKDIYLCEALKMAEENTHEHQDINVFIKDDSGNFHEIFSLKKEMDLHKSMGDILSYYPRWYNRENFKRKQFIAFLRARQAAKQLARYEKEDLQQQK
jgi:hypothetical protein